MGIEAAIAAAADFAASFGAADVGAAALGSEAALGSAEAAGITGAELGADALAAGGADALALGGADALGGLGAAGGLGGLGGAADAAGGSLAFAGADAAGVASPLIDLSGAGLAAPASAVGGAAPLGAAPIDLASAAGSGGLGGFGGDVTALSGAADSSLNPSNWLGFETIDPATGSTIGGGTFDAAGAVGGTGSSLGQAAGAGTDLSALTGGTGSSLGEAASGGASGAAGTGSSIGQAASGGGSVFDNLISGAAKGVTANPLGTAVAAGGLGYNILQSNKLSANEQALMASAGAQANQGASLQSYLQSGQLPPGMAAQVANATAAAKAKIVSGYAARGQPADPAKNSALAQELSQVDMNAVAMQGQLATSLLNSGLNETQMSNQLYQALIQMDQANAANIGKSIANFSGALAGGPKTIQIGGTSA